MKEAQSGKIKVGYSDFKRVHQSHDPHSANNLLLYYAVECGLKYLILKRASLRHSEELPIEQRSHDLVGLRSALKLGPVRNQPQGFKLAGSFTSPTYPIHLAHEVWRYGVEMNKDDETKLVAWLTAVYEQIRGQDDYY